MDVMFEEEWRSLINVSRLLFSNSNFKPIGRFRTTKRMHKVDPVWGSLTKRKQDKNKRPFQPKSPGECIQAIDLASLDTTDPLAQWLKPPGEGQPDMFKPFPMPSKKSAFCDFLIFFRFFRGGWLAVLAC
jgi:hypothetical protein